MEATCSKGWGSRCASSKGQKCTCKCGGKNHGTTVQPGLTPRPARTTGSPRIKGTKRTVFGEVYHYKGYHGCPSKCGLDIRVKGDRAIVFFTELPDNPGSSITNMIEVLATQVYHERLKGVPIENIRFVEHYPDPDGYFDLAVLKWTGLEFKSPTWKRIDLDKWSVEGGVDE